MYTETEVESGLRDFENQLRTSGYKELEPFYLLYEGEMYDERTGGIQKVDKQRLERLAKTQNLRTSTSGDATPIVVGHTRRGLPEEAQPAIVGLAPRWRVTKFANTNKWALEAVPWCKPENESKFDQYKRRSIEFWTDPDVIDPISLLGANTPRLDLGLHRLSKGSTVTPLHMGKYNRRKPLYFEMGDDMPDMALPDAPATPSNVQAAAGANSDQMSYVMDCCAQFQELKQLLQPLLDEIKQGQMGAGAGGPPGGPGGPMPAGGPGGPGGPPPAPAGGPGGGGADDYDDDDDDEPIQASYGPTGGQNTMTPTYFGNGQPQQPQRRIRPRQQQQQPQRNARGIDPRDAEIRNLQNQVLAMQLQRIDDTVNATLDELETKIVINRQREYDKLVKMSKSDFDAEVTYMLEHYKPKEEPLPGSGVPMQFHAAAPQQTTLGGNPNAPITMEQARQMMQMQADPTMAQQQQPMQNSMHNRLFDIVRNRKKGENVMDAYSRIMGGDNNGGNVTQLRG